MSEVKHTPLQELKERIARVIKEHLEPERGGGSITESTRQTYCLSEYRIPQLAEAILSLLPPQSVPEWRPIDENTPRDRDILAIRMDWWEPVNGNSRWIYSDVRQTRWIEREQRFDFGGMKQPTHWCELNLPAAV